MILRVVDADIVATLLFNDPHAEEIAGYLEYYDLIAPAIIRYEIDCLCLERIKGNYYDRQRYLVAPTLLDSLRLSLIDQNNSAIVDYACRHEISIAAASYHHLSETFNAKLLSLKKYLAHWTES